MTPPTPTKERWKGLLRGSGLRVTKPRLAVLDLLDTAGAPRSHAEVVEELGEAGWDRATLFRNLNDLAAAGLLRRFDVGDHIWRFELVKPGSPEHNHAHFVCVDCGEVRCIDGVELRAPAGEDRLLSGDVEIQLRGTCADCA